MARLPRLAVGGQVHLVRQRGNNGQALFADRADREAFLLALRESARAHAVAIHAYALTDSEFLLLATPAQARGLSEALQAVGRRYVAAFNRRHGRSGTLWEGRFRATVIEAETYLLAGLCFVEQAALRADLSGGAADEWSSARHHLGRVIDPLVSDHMLYWSTGNTPFEREAAHRRLLEHGLSESEVAEMSDALNKGWALGSSEFVANVELQTRRRAKPAKRGRRAKSAA